MYVLRHCGSLQWMNSPVRLEVFPPATTPKDFYSQKFWGFLYPHWNPGLHVLSHSTFVPTSLPTCKCGIPSPPATILPTQSSSCHLTMHPFCPGYPSRPLLPVWMNVSLTPWLSDFHIVKFSGSSGYCLFLNLLLSVWLWEEAKCIYLRLHLGQKSWDSWPLVPFLLFECVTCQGVSSNFWPPWNSLAQLL